MVHRQDGLLTSLPLNASWYCVALNASDLARDWHGILLTRFEAFFRALKEPPDMAMFITPMTDRGATLYFSPGIVRAPAFITLANAAICDAPCSPVVRIAGHSKADEILKQGSCSSSKQT